MLVDAGGGGGDAVRPTGWDVLGYSSDPVPGDPGNIRTLASSWKTMATSIETAGKSIESAKSEADSKSAWQGEASEQFLEDIEDVSTGYTDASGWYTTAYEAMHTWAAAVEHAQTKADKALQKAKAAQQTYDHAQTKHETAESSLRYMAFQPPPPPGAPSLDDQKTDLKKKQAAAESDMNEAEGIIKAQKAKAQAAKQEYDQAAKVAINALNGVANAIGKAPQIPGTSAISHSASSQAKFGYWKVISGGKGGPDGSNAGYVVAFGAGGYRSSEASFTHDGKDFDAKVSNTDFFGAQAMASGTATAGHGILSASVTGTLSGMAAIYSTSSASASFKNGNLDAQVSTHDGAEVKGSLSGNAQVLNGLLKVGGDLNGQAGAAVEADAKLHIGKDGASVSAGTDDYAGARFGGDVNGALGNAADIGGGGGFRAGVGVEAHIGGSLSAKDVSLSLNVGGALGIGGDLNLNVDVHPAAVVGDAKKLGSSIIHHFGL